MNARDVDDVKFMDEAEQRHEFERLFLHYRAGKRSLPLILPALSPSL